MKAAIVSHVLPPTPSGQALILERLLRPCDPETYVLVRTMEPSDDITVGSPLEARTFTVPEPEGTRGHPFHRGKPRILIGMSALRSRARALTELIDAEGCDTVVACTGGDMLDIPAAYYAARSTGSRYIPYYFDYWSQQAWINRLERRVAQLVEGWILPRSTEVIVPNSALANELSARHGIVCSIVANACEASQDLIDPIDDSPLRQSPRIVYTGAIYDANLDCFRNLIRALHMIDGDFRVQLYTAQGPDELAESGLDCGIEIYPHRPLSDIYMVQKSADILFLPLGFSTPYPDLIRTSNPAKMCEYLWSGRPILVHAPSDTFVAAYFREHRCGLVVDENDPASLALALKRLLVDGTLRRSLAEAARARAAADYGLDQARALFSATVGLSTRGGSQRKTTG